jgi:poly(hydroxyalkanoate) depolymerase family esterase
MNLNPPLDLREATRLVRAGRLTAATAAIQRLLGSQTSPGVFPAIGSGSMLDRIIPSLDIEVAETSPMLRQDPGRESTFVAQTFSNHAGSRPYKLYIPSGYHGRPVPLIVMLHGCSQSPDDFAAGARMNLAAEAQTFMVAYPGQTSAANSQKCWNWFSPADQQRDSGEPSLIAGITRQVMRDQAIDPARVYVAGLSAGGAAASIMGNTYPDLYAAIGVHSGLACGAACDLLSAFSVMQSGGDGRIRFDRRRVVPAIVFHGERDSTVNVRNGDAVVAQTVNGMSLRIQVETGQVPGGHAYTRTLYIDADGDTLVEKWVVQGAGHAWFGGSAAGSYTDPRGPDATKEMLRFFRKHAL